MNKSSVRWIAFLALSLLFILPISEAMAAPIGKSAPEAIDHRAELVWNTFLGSSWPVWYTSIVRDPGGNSYVAGESDESWGNPIRAFPGTNAVFISKLDVNGNLVWTTFLGGEGGPSSVSGLAIAQDGSIFVVGFSWDSWSCLETPCTIRPYGDGDRIFIARLSPDGALLWNTFLGGDRTNRVDLRQAITVGSSGAVYVMGWSRHSWGAPIRPFTNEYDTYVARLDLDGNLIWNTFLGGSGYDDSSGIATDSLGNVFVVGTSNRGWSCDTTPPSCRVRPYTEDDAFVAKLGPNGSLLWNTFLGGDGSDTGYGIVVDPAGRVFVTGASAASWETPIRAYTEGSSEQRQGDAFVAELDDSGNLLWNTFLGGSNVDKGLAVNIDQRGHVYVAGASSSGWDTTATQAKGGAFVAGMNMNGDLMWNAFLGASSLDLAAGIVPFGDRNLLVSGTSDVEWGSPLRPFPGPYSAFVAQLAPVFSTQWLPWSAIAQ